MATRVFLDGIEQPMLIVSAPTGVIYEHQCDGGACRQEEAEGFLVPISDSRLTLPLARLLLNKPHAPVDEIAPLVAAIEVQIGEETSALSLDMDRLGDLVEAFVPVRAGSHTGTLVWRNSD